MATQNTAPQEFLDQQVELLQAGDAAGLAERYAEDAVFVRFDRIAHGREEIRKLFEDYLAEQPQITGMDGLQVTDDMILYQAPEQLSGRLTTAVGTIVFRNSLVWRQTVAFVEHRPLRQSGKS
jgi:ketosteroid isomerase-like protein